MMDQMYDVPANKGNMRKDKLVKIALLVLALSFVMVSIIFLPACDDRESSPTRANVDSQIRPLLEEALNAKLVRTDFFNQYGSPPASGTKPWVIAMGTNYDVEGRLLDSSQVVNSLVNVVQSLGVQEFEPGTVGNTSIVIFKGLSIEGGIWGGFIRVHRQMVGWELRR
jgi:hypothetical protein